MNSTQLLLIFTKNPVLGKCKTRLAKTIGDDAALIVYNSLLKHTALITEPLNMVKEVHYSDRVEENDIWNETYIKKEQYGDDLGERMENAFKKGFQQGFQHIVIIGSDIFDLATHELVEAFEKLKTNDYVVGPSEDGGYYLLGMNTLNTALFRDKTWSSETVLPDTLSVLKKESYALLKEHNDIDTYEDLQAFQESAIGKNKHRHTSS